MTPDGKKRQVGLENAVKLWPTPRANDAEKRGDFNADDPRNDLAGAVKKCEQNFATPTATMHKGWSANHNRAETNDRLDYQIERGAEGVGRLNPQWVEWLMGWPLGWTDLKPLETDRFREWLAQHGGF